MPKWTVSSKVACYLTVLGLFTFYLCVTGTGDAKSRDKRQVSTELPRIVTKDGHLLFMTGVNHNITFQSAAGGFVNVDGKNLKDFFGKIPDNLKEKLTSMESLSESVTNSVIPNVNNVKQDLQSFHTQLDTLSNQVQNDLSSKVVQLTQENHQLKSRIEQLEQRGSSTSGTSESDTINILTRLTTLEGRLRDRISATTTTTNSIMTRLSTLEARPSPMNRASRRRIFSNIRDLNRKVTTLTSALEANNCQSNPCRNGGSCYDRYNGFHCNCQTGWTGETCADDVNECSEFQGTDLGCQNGGSCINTPGAYRCQCTADWHGLHCNSRHDDCTGASNSEICGHGTCINQPRNHAGQPKYKCICEAGWTHAAGSVTCTEDVDECQSSTSCFQHSAVHCINFPGSFTCSPCPPGFTGNGFACNDVDECEVNNGGCSLNPRVTCLNTQGSRTCGQCPADYTGNGISCQYVGLCHVNNGGCSSLATCTENRFVIGGRICTCRQGYIGTGFGPGGCRILAPTENPCLNNPCQNGGTCQVSEIGNFTCLCLSNFTGSLCEARLDRCASNPCQNGGTCVLTSVSYSCECTSSFSGTRCETQREECGGRFYNPSGMIAYPSEPGVVYPHGIDCEWVIKVSSSKVVQLNFTGLRTECHYDWLDVVDSETRYGTRLGRYCRLSDVPNNGIINSTGRGLRLWLHSDSSMAYEGFNVSWTSQEPECGYAIQGSHHGNLQSPNYPYNYPTHRTCTWTISMDPGQRISIMFSTFRLENHHTCNYDYLEIRDGLTADSPLLGKYCNRVKPQPMISPGPYLYFKFHSDSSRTDKGFDLIYTATQAQQEGCGSVLSSHSGTLTSPNFPNPYSSNEDCVWIIQPGHTLILTFNNIDLPAEPPCTTDYVEIRDGSTPTSRLIGRYCGQTAPPYFTSNKNSLWINFKSGEASSYVGFSLQWRIACGGVFTSPSGILQSPFYGSAGDNSSEELCIFVIRQPPTKRISVLFNEFGQSESDKELQNCTSNYLEIRHGDTKSSPLLGKYCGSDNLPPASVATGLMRIEYKGGPDSLGFQANYTTTNLDCGGIVTGDMGSISSPHISLGHSHQNCVWHIIVDPGKLIRLSFTNFHLFARCTSIFIELKNEGESHVHRYCGRQIPPVFTSTSNKLRMQFVNFLTGFRSSFHAVYHTINQTNECGGILKSPAGSVMSPNFPEKYPKSINCIWSIQVAMGHRIQLTFYEFDVEKSSRCVYDSLAVRNGGSSGSPLIGFYCEKKNPFTILSQGNQLWLMFTSDNSIERKGFNISYSSAITGCGGDIVSPTGSIISPNYPNAFMRAFECVWRIHVSAGNKIGLAFGDFHLSTSCYMQSVEVRDPNRHGRQVGRYCGHETPHQLVSSSNSLFVKFNMRMVTGDISFRINYNTVCRDIQLDDISGRIESPGFPNNYMNFESCSWVISGLYGNAITIEFSHFQLEKSTNCTYDYLTVRNGDQITSPLVDKLCGSLLPPKITSTGSKLRIDFKTDHFITHTGFRIEYRQEACIRKFDRNNGRIRFPEDNYMQIRGKDIFCVWIIKVGPGMRVQLNVSNLKLDGADSCTDEFLKITDGDTLKAPKLATLCHTIQQIALTTSTGSTMTILYKVKPTTKDRIFRASFNAVPGGCGGIYRLVDGSIQSPNYPNDAPRNSTCDWLIIPKKAHFIVLTFDDLDMGRRQRTTNCTENYLQILQDNEVSEVFCKGNSVIGKSFTYESSVLLSFRTGDRFSGRGFKVNYTQECGISYSASIGGIISSEDLQGAASCRWLLIANQSDERVTLYFSKFSGSPDCKGEYVKIYNGMDKNAPLIDTYCGRRIPPVITSSGSGLYIVASKKKNLVFHATYSTSVSSCGGEIYAGTGAISTPGYPDNYPMNMQCIWQFKIAPGNSIHLSFSEFSLETYDFCNKDYLEARSVNVSGSLIGRFCEGKPQNITTSGDLWLKFRSDEDNTRRGFIANYEQIFGGAISGSSGKISIPDWDSPTYPVVWTITVDEGLVVFIVLKQMRFFTFQDACVGYLEVRDGLSAESPLIGQYCEDERITLYSSSNQIYLKYAPFRNYKQEMSLYWRAVSNITARHLVNQGRRITTPQYSYNLKATDAIQNVTSPGFPNGYPSNLIAQWYIYADKGYHIWVNFTTIDLDSQCAFDYIEYRVPAYSTRRTVCEIDQLDGPIEYRSNNIYVTLNTDHVNSGKGFAASYKRKCGGRIIIETSVVISSRNLESDCIWKFHTSVYYRLTAKVVFRHYRKNNCTDDFLRINDGLNSFSRPLLTSSGDYCRNNTIQTFNSTGYFLYIRLKKDFGPDIKIIVERKGSNCGGHRVLDAIPSGYIQTINYPNGYPGKVECEWIISAPGLQRVQIDVKDYASRCPYDFLEFRDGSTISSPRLQMLCGRNRSISTIYSRSNVMYVRFRTNRGSSLRGFRIKYSIAKCGGKIISHSGIIKSDHYPKNYENNMNCKWNIHVREGHFISLDLLDFKLQESTNCTADYLEIKEIQDDDGVLFHGCGQNIPNRIQSSGNELEITFKTDHTRVSQGFTLNFTESEEECGGILENNYGIISSPGYPNTVRIRRRCTWKIRVRPDRSVTLHFADRSTIPCGYSSVRIFNSWEPTRLAQVASICGNGPETIQTSGNEVTVIYQTVHSRWRVLKFSASYNSDQERLCGGLLTSSSGNVSSPDYRNSSRAIATGVGFLCKWLLQPPIRDNETTILDLELETGRQHCYERQLQIFDGVDVTGKLIANICSAKMRKRIVSSSRSLVILYISRYAGRRVRLGGISIRYSSSGCGGILTADSGEITSPHFPRSYPIEADCNWKISGPANSKINITVLQFDLEESNNCEKDFVNILNGGNYGSPSIAKLCGHKNPISYITQTNKASIQFHSDNTTAARGFRIRYAVDSEVCGGYHHGKKGRIMSPNYPHSYPAQKECIWKIKAPPGYTVQLKFLPPFDLERSTNCQNDYVMIEGNMQGKNDFQQKKFCDSESVKDQKYNLQNELTITFKSNNRISGSGFLIEWETECIMQFYERSGYILSPGYPNPYQNNMHCTYTILSDPGSFVKLTFENFSLERSYGCRMDYVKVRYGNRFRSVQTYCGSRSTSQARIRRGPMKIEFKTDGVHTDQGFKIFYEILECGGVYTGASGQIENIKTYGHYISNMNCTYHINVEEERVVSLRFTEFRIEQHRTCSYDYMAVYDGNTTSSPLIGKFCGWTPPDPIKSSTNMLLLHFVTDHSVQSVGFKAIYNAAFGRNVGCGGDLGNSTGLLRSIDINNDGLYENSLYCHWRITVDFDKVVQLTFGSFDVQSSSNCEKDSLTILSYVKKKKYCGYQIPQPITSVSNVMEVWFKTDASNQRSGFTATYTSLLSYCGGRLLANETAKSIASPTRASLYQPRHGTPKCRWMIVAPENYQIRINVTQMDILQNCSGEYLLIREPTIPHYSYKYCGQELPNILYSHTSSIEINFITQALSESEKFSLQYSLADCNRNYNATNGELHSPGWPGRHRNAARCKMNITSPVGTKLSLYFYAFKLEYHYRCAYDYLQVKYFTNSTHQETSKFCSSFMPFPIFSTSNRIELYFKSDASISFLGFHVIFTSTMQDSGCGGNLTSINGTFTSPNYPAFYPETAPNNTVPQEKECQWNIRVPMGRQINLVFADFSLGQNSNDTNCITNYVKIYTGIRNRNTLYTTECSDNIPDSIISTSNVMTVVMASDGIARTPKFRIRYTS